MVIVHNLQFEVSGSNPVFNSFFLFFFTVVLFCESFFAASFLHIIERCRGVAIEKF